MKALFLFLAICFLIYGLGTSIMASTVMQQIIGGIAFMISAILIVGSATIEALDRMYRVLNINEERRATVLRRAEENKQIIGEE